MIHYGLDCDEISLPSGLKVDRVKEKNTRNRLPKPKNNMKLKECALKGPSVRYSPESLREQMANEDAKWAYLKKLYHENPEAYYCLYK